MVFKWYLNIKCCLRLLVSVGWLIKVFFAMVNFVHMMCTKSLSGGVLLLPEYSWVMCLDSCS